jgi:hypothetical protein
MNKNFHHGEHGGHGVEEEFSVSFSIFQPAFLQNFYITPSSLTSVLSVSSVVKPLCFPLA